MILLWRSAKLKDGDGGTLNVNRNGKLWVSLSVWNKRKQETTWDDTKACAFNGETHCTLTVEESIGVTEFAETLANEKEQVQSDKATGNPKDVTIKFT
jgi:hypothetical protein